MVCGGERGAGGDGITDHEKGDAFITPGMRSGDLWLQNAQWSCCQSSD